MIGRVSLIGAGPGDPALLTRRAVARLHHADLVLFDALVDERTLRLARRAQYIYVGKRAGDATNPQPSICARMIEAARAGRRVVRLKGGDPFVFGRGGEEVLALQKAGIPFDIVPGVSSATAAAAAAGIPVTHRGLASAFLVLTGHATRSLVATLGSIAPNTLTLIILMGLRHRAAVAHELIARGWRADTPAAVVADAWCVSQQIWRGALHHLPAAEIEEERAGTIIIGSVAALDLRFGDD